MTKPLLPDEWWAIVEPLLPPDPPKPNGGRPRVPDRAALTGIIVVLKSGIPWEMLPQEMGRGSGVTCWRRLRDWQEAGGGTVSTTPSSTGSATPVGSIGAGPAWTVPVSRQKGSEAVGPNPTDRGKPGTKHHVIGVRIARNGIESSQRLGRHRRVIECTLAWFNRERRLAIRHERRVGLHQAFLTLRCALVCFNHRPPQDGL